MNIHSAGHLDDSPKEKLTYLQATKLAEKCKGKHLGWGVVECRDPQLIDYFSDAIGEACEKAVMADDKVVEWKEITITGIDHVRVCGGISIRATFFAPVYKVVDKKGVEEMAGSIELRNCRR